MRFRSTRIIGAVAAVTIAAMSLAGCSADTQGDSDAETGLSLTLGMSGDVSTWSPQLTADGGVNIIWAQPVYDTLLRETPTGEYVGFIADSYEYDESLTTLTLQIHPGITFSSGDELTAEGVKTNLEATRDGTGALSTQLGAIESIDIPDDETVVLNLSEPDPALIRTLSQPAGMIGNPEKVASGALETEPDGTGPYQLDLDQSVKGSEYVFTKKADYWNTEIDLPYETLHYKVLADATAKFNALKNGQIDGAAFGADLIAEAEASNLKVLDEPGNGLFGAYILDRAGAIQPALADVRVRQAINMAFDRAAYVDKLLAGHGTATEQVFNPNTDAWVEELNETYPFDIEGARQLLADAGYPDGFSVDIADPGWYVSQTPILQQALADIGIQANLVKVPGTDGVSEMQSGRYPIILMQLQSTNPWQAIRFFIAPDGPWNVLDSEDPKVSELIQAARTESGEDQVGTYRELSAYLVDQAWFAPWYVPNNVFITSADVDATPQINQGIPSIYNYAPAN